MKHYFYGKQHFKFSTLPLVFSLLIFTFFSFLFSCAGGAQNLVAALGRPDDPVPFMEGARTGILPSGMRYYLLENAKPENRAYLTLAVDAGSVLETEEDRGLAHFVEHMAFNGTARFPGLALVDYLRSLGMRFGPEVNAYTSYDETVYGIEVPVETDVNGLKKIPDTAFAVIDDWTFAVTFDPKDVDEERLVILEEYRAGLGAQERMRREIIPVLFRDSPYADRDPIGLPEIIENVTAETLENFYKKWYRPENMALIIVGDFDAQYTETVLQEHFPDHERNNAPFTRPNHDLPEPERGRFESLVLTDSELTSSTIELCWKLPSEVQHGDLIQYRESVVQYLIDTMLALRFEEASVKPETPYAYAGGGMIKEAYSSRFYLLVAQAKTGSVNTSLMEMLLVRESLLRYGFVNEELEMAANSLIAYMEQAVSEKDNQPSNYYIEAFTRHFLEGETVPDFEWELDAIKKLLPNITLSEVNETVKDFFRHDDLSIFITAPEAEQASLPSKDEILAMLEEAERADIAPPSADAGKRELLESAPTPGAIVSETVDEETGAVRLLLGNGAEVILKETRNRNSEISFYAQARGGTLSAPEEANVSAVLTDTMLNVSGLGRYSRPELTRILLDKQVNFSFWTQFYLRGFQGGAAVKDIKTLFEILHLSFTQPRLDPGAISAMLDQLRSSMTFEENNPETVLSREIAKTSYGNPRFHPIELRDLENVNIDDAIAFVGRCLNPADYTFVFAGNIDLPLFRSLIESYIASIPRSQAFDEWALVDPRHQGETEREIYLGKEERGIVYLKWTREMPYSEEKSAAVSVLSEYLDIILTERIRETLGGVYGISNWVSISPVPRGELSGGASFICDPKRTVELSSAVIAEFQKAANGNIDTGTLEKAIEALVKSQEDSVQSNLYIAQSYANSAVIFRSPLNRLDRRPAMYRAVNSFAVQTAAAELLEGTGIRLVLYPEAGAATEPSN